MPANTNEKTADRTENLRVRRSRSVRLAPPVVLIAGLVAHGLGSGGQSQPAAAGSSGSIYDPGACRARL